jgi:hypothetical protein
MEVLGGGKRFFELKTEAKGKSVLGNVLSVGNLFEARKFALRRGIWFRALNRLERGVVDLTVRYVDEIRSAKLTKVLTVILAKLQLAVESVMDKMVRSDGFAQARKISRVALSWGRVSALAWAEDGDFARFLAVMLMNGSGIFRT